MQLLAPHVTAFSWEYFTIISSLFQPVLALCLAALQPGQLAELQLWGNLRLQEPTVDALHRLSGVTRLVLDMNSSTSVQAALGALGSPLRSLELLMDAPPPALLDTIVQLTQLTALAMRAMQWPALDPLTRLCCLKQLILTVAIMARGPTQLPPPASFPAGLDRYCFDSEDQRFQVRQLGLLNSKYTFLKLGSVYVRAWSARSAISSRWDGGSPAGCAYVGWHA